MRVQLFRQGKEQPWSGRPASRLLSPLPAHAHSTARVPQRKVSSASGAAEVPKRRPGRWSNKSAPVKVETKPKKVAGKDKSSDRKVQTKGEKGAMGKQVEVANQETEDLLASNGEIEKKESPASDGAGKKEVIGD
ncbi:non-histone chromosomal protein HMG-14-like [Budorcas taxicolor]|uniref:non-histone chromosomal protein HMG-14-like n=1 Tax=Budorcas taxicolor TaxID=37181 RepID=UPI0022841B33|nr:non-histone chromosomal protein HMG-14-like [Budorcas taxicolor]